MIRVNFTPQLDKGTGTVVSSLVRGIKAEEEEEEAGETTGTTITVAVVATLVAEGGEVVGAGPVEPEETVVGETETAEDMAKARVVVQNMAALQTLTKTATLHPHNKQTTTHLTMAQHSSRLL